MWNFLFTKEMKKKKGNTTDMTLGNLSDHRMFSNRQKGKYDMMSEIYLLQFSKKILFVIKLS